MSNYLSNFTELDFEQIKNKSISKQSIEFQIKQFTEGIAPAPIIEAATISNKGIKTLSKENLSHYTELFDKQGDKYSIIKFVPASGAATRMFKTLFEFINSNNNNTVEIQKLITNIKKFAFYDDLQKYFKSQNSDIAVEISNGNYTPIIEAILLSNGLEYGSLPKGLLKFHKYDNGNRTAFEEHLNEAFIYAKTNEKVKIHFTVSPEHLEKFEIETKRLKEKYFDKNFKVEFSTQSPATDTIALTPENIPFRKKDGSILFRPGGHGALIHNLNKIKSDIIFIKNIDNIVPDRLKTKTCPYKKAIAGILLEMQKRTFEFIYLLRNNPSRATIQEAFDFLINQLSVKIFFDFNLLSKPQMITFLLKKFNRPLRVCAMVRNEGEPGGGPFFVMQEDQTASLQIVEKSQINLSDTKTAEIFNKSTHFNPVDIVFSPINYDKQKFDLVKLVDHKTGFISEKSIEGKQLKALELPGLWNGAMADWNTIFVEVPIDTFNPVKTIFDLLRENHQ